MGRGSSTNTGIENDELNYETILGFDRNYADIWKESCSIYDIIQIFKQFFSINKNNWFSHIWKISFIYLMYKEKVIQNFWDCKMQFHFYLH